jgi:tyrosinase
MGDAYNSPGDPLFYLHHGNLDRLFWEWQKRDLRRRLTDVSGPIYMFDYANVKGGNVTLGFEIGLGPLGKMKQLKELMDIRRKDICYTYV